MTRDEWRRERLHYLTSLPGALDPYEAAIQAREDAQKVAEVVASSRIRFEDVPYNDAREIGPPLGGRDGRGHGMLGWLSDKLSGGVGVVVRKVGIAWFLRQVRKAAEGDFGPKVKASYDALSGVKTLTGGTLVATSAVLVAIQSPYAEVVGIVGGVLVSAGLIDKEWRNDTIAQALREFAWYRILLEWSPVLTALMGIWITSIQQGVCLFDCGWDMTISTILGVIFVQAGLMRAAGKAAAPAK